jgi:methylmalonyl-CoA/ethylmalonyl-CoA epimerase
LITGFNHVSIVVPDLDAAIVKIGTLFGLRAGQAQINEAQGVRIAYVDLGNARIELMEPSRPDAPIAKFLARNPQGGIHHFCLDVDDVAGTTAAFAANGARVLGDGSEQRNVDGNRIAFVHPKDFLGALLELEQHPSG